MCDDVMALRAEMTAEGWDSEDRITRMGWADGPGYSIWFRRSDWHGKRALVLTGHFAVYHAHVADPAKALEAVRTEAALARRAWTGYPDCPPQQGSAGALIARTPIKLD